MFQNLQRIGVAALLSAVLAAPSFAQSGYGEKFRIADASERQSAAPALEPKGRKHAIVIAVSTLNDKSQPELPFVENDARRMIETLYDDGFTVWPVCDESVPTPEPRKDDDGELEERVEPTKKNIEATVEKVLQDEIGADDVLFVYFSGHGLEGSGDKTLLFAKDSNASDVENTCVSLKWLRDMLSQREKELQKQKGYETVEPRCVLALDSCHAGSTRSARAVDAVKAAYADLEDYVAGGADGVATFVSCAWNEESSGWTPYVFDPFDVADGGKERDVSIFTYWLNVGLKGFADGAVDGEANGKIESDELYKYVHDNVKLHRGYEQTTQVVARSSETSFVLCDVPTAARDETLFAVAKQIVTKAKLLRKNDVDLNVKAVGCEKFATDAKSVDDLTSFARYANDALQRNVDELMKDAAKKGGGSPVEVDATVELAEREIVGKNGETKTVVEYVVACSFDAAEFNGRTEGLSKAALEVRARVPAKKSGESARRDVAPKESQAIGTTVPAPGAAAPAPVALSDDEFDDEPTGPAFVVPKVETQASVDGGATWETRPIYRGADGANWVELNPGETYRVVVRRSDEPTNPEVVGFRLLIDGRNTLPQAETQLYAAETQGYAGTRSAATRPITRLDDARWWSLNLNQNSAFDAFYSRLDRKGGVFVAEGNKFLVAPVDALGASTSGQNGLIDVAFYSLKDLPNPRNVSDVETEEGGETRAVFDALVGKEPDRPLASFRLRYASAARLAELGVAESELSGATTGATLANEPLGTRSASRSYKKAADGNVGTDKNDAEDETTSDGILR